MGRMQLSFNGVFGCLLLQPLHFMKGNACKNHDDFTSGVCVLMANRLSTFVKRLDRLYCVRLGQRWHSFCEAMFSKSRSPRLLCDKGPTFLSSDNTNTDILADFKAPDGSDQKPLCTNRHVPCDHLILLPSPDFAPVPDASSAKLKSPPEAIKDTVGRDQLLKVQGPPLSDQNIYCARGQMENFIKNHKTFLPLRPHDPVTADHGANQIPSFLHSAAYKSCCTP